MSESPISIACSECSNQIQKTYEQLQTSEALKCPACGRQMTEERAAVVRHVEAIRRAMAGVRRRA